MPILSDRLQDLLSPRGAHQATISDAEANAVKDRAFALADSGDNDAALALWLDLIAKRPDWSIGFAGGAATLRRLRRWQESRRVLEAALGRFGREAVLYVELGRLYFDQGDWNTALTAFRDALDAAPDWSDCHVGVATALAQLHRYDEADAILAAAMRMFPDASFIVSNHAVTADLRGDRQEALKRWRSMQGRFPDEPIGYAGLGAALKMLDRFDEADAILEEGMRRFPADSNIAINHAWVTVASGDWTEALRRWNVLKERWPDESRVQDGLSETVMQSQLAAADRDGAAAAPASVAPATPGAADPEICDMMMRFESLGENCELGFVQRRFGAEPLGLFRWAGIGLPQLLDGLDSGFAGVGDGEQTRLAVNPSNREYYTEDSRFGMRMHSFILEGATPATAVKAKLLRRLSYLRDKLLADLAEGEKILVFNAPGALHDDALRQLHEAILGYGRAALLCVGPGGAAPGTVSVIGPGLWRGHLGRTGFNGRIWEVEWESWLAICRAASDLHKGYRAAGPIPTPVREARVAATSP